MVELLLENGANPNIHDKQERKPIHWASFVGYTEIIKILKKYGADINSVDKEVLTFIPPPFLLPLSFYLLFFS
jgi:ankyrin repeat protein